MLSKKLYKKSRFLSLLLRHKPEKAGLTLDRGGWVDVIQLLNAINLTSQELYLIVQNNNKSRFAFCADGQKIRASQGHSIPVDLGLISITPPDILYHGTVELFVKLILTQGILKMGRHDVHLSADTPTAEQVATRKPSEERGDPYILSVDAKRMWRDNFSFFRSDNGVWLTDNVPAKYIVHVARPTGE